jgi:homoserine acetyltransferase
MVHAQHLLVTKYLRVDHLRLVMGTSMGGMHTWMWGDGVSEHDGCVTPPGERAPHKSPVGIG